MFIGHWAPAFVAAALTPERPKLGTFFIAAQLVDWAFMLFVLVGLEGLRIAPGITAMNAMDLYHYPYTHSLVGTAAFAAAFATGVRFVTGSWRGALPAAAVVASHWLLDLLVHRPDMTLAGGEPKLGLGLWNVPAAEMPLELALTFGAAWFFARRTRGPMLPLVILCVALLAAQAVDWFGAQPTEYSTSIPLVALSAFTILTALAFWVGRTRTVRATSSEKR